jgi:peptidoglycan/LPS O-acetylase OafA/YrhL
MCIALAYLSKDTSKNRIMLTLIGLLALYNGTTQVRIIVIGAIVILFLGRDRIPFVVRLCSSTAAKFAADISYSSYLLHNLLLYPILLMLKRQAWFAGLDLNIQLTCAFAIIGAPVVFLSYLLFRFIERPGIEMGRKLSPDIVRYIRGKCHMLLGMRHVVRAIKS